MCRTWPLPQGQPATTSNYFREPAWGRGNLKKKEAAIDYNQVKVMGTPLWELSDYSLRSINYVPVVGGRMFLIYPMKMFSL